MNIRSKFLASYFFLVFLSISVGLIFIVRVKNLQNTVGVVIPDAVEDLSRVSYLDSLAQSMRYDDEALTQSARNYAFTGDVKWKDRYTLLVGDLDAVLKKAEEKGDETEKKFFEDVDEANRALVDMEETSLNLVDQGNRPEAIALLESDRYWRYKEVYHAALNEYLKKRSTENGGAILVPTNTLKDAGASIQRSISSILEVFALGIVAGAFAAAVFSWRFSSAFTKPILELSLAMREVVTGNPNKRLEVTSKDEFGELSSAFNAMADELQEDRKSVERKIAERTVELERLNAHMVGRELKMAELKARLAALERGEK